MLAATVSIYMDEYRFYNYKVGTQIGYPEKIREISNSLTRGNLVFFLGSGVSTDKPACVPTGIMLKNKIINEAFTTLENCLSRDVYPSYGLEVAKELFDNMMLEKVISHFYYIFGDIALKLVGVLDGKIPNFNHYAIASIASQVANNGYCQNVISLNFDCLLERVLENIQVAYRTDLPLSFKKGQEIDLSFGDNKASVVIYKPHGSFFVNSQAEDRFVSVRATLETIGDRPSEENEARIREIIQGKDMLFMGYGDKDVDIFPIFQKAFGYRKVYWCEFYALEQEEKEEGIDEKVLKQIKDKKENLYSWLNSLGESATVFILIANRKRAEDNTLENRTLKRLLRDIIKNIGSQIPKENIDEYCVDEKTWEKNVEWISQHSDMTLLVLADILEGSGDRELAAKIFDFLYDQYKHRQILENNHKLKAYFLFRRSNALHTLGTINHYRSAYKNLKEAQGELKKLPESISLEKLIEYESWAAYECWSIFKKTFNPFMPIRTVRDIVRFMLSPWYFLKGVLLFLKAKRRIKFLTDESERANRYELISSWFGDIFRYYAKILIIFFKTNIISNVLLKMSLPFYSKAAKRGHTYYVLRRDEVKILLGQADDEIIKNIEQIVHYYKTIEDNLGIGNSLCVRALTKRDNKGKAADDLNEAEKAYARHSKESKTSEHPSGLMEVIIYRRLIGIVSMRGAIVNLSKLIK